MKKSITTINPKVKKKEQTPKKDKRIYLVYLQFFLTIAIVVMGIITIFQRSFFPWFQLTLGITLLLMGINNRFTYRRKYFTLIYSIIGIGIIVFFILGQIGV